MSETPFGYHGRYLRVDLTTRKTESISIPSDVLRKYIGGAGLGTWLLLEETNGSPDALGAESPLIFVFSPLVGSPLTTSAKFAVLAKSPLTERINDSLSSSSFAISGKKTGYDAFVITGVSDSPTCLVIESEGIRFDDAGDVWGKTLPQTAAHFQKQLGPSYRLAAIGPAGENLVRFATISHDGRHAGRGGLGAVMGSKNLKAVAVRGNRLTEFADPDRLNLYSKQLSKKSFGPATAKYRELGTVSNLLVFNRLGTLPTRNFQSGTFEQATALSPEVMGESHSRTRASCAACTIGCEHIFQLSNSQDSGSAENGVRMEYENLFALGPLCGVGEAGTVLQASKLCDEWGMDTISAGGTIAFAMECAERGLIDAPELRFGNGQALLNALNSIGSRSGLGELLSMGSRAAAREIGQGSEAFAPHVKGLEIPGYEPRAMQTMALGFAVGTRGADHNRSGAYQVDFSDAVDRLHVGPEAVPLAIETEDESAVMDSLILCKFLRGVFDDKLAGMAEMLRLVTGWETTALELRNTAQRIVTAKKWYNIQQGWTPSEDTLPPRFLSEPLATDANAKTTLTESTLRSLIKTYNLARSWSSEGWVTEQQIAELELRND